MSTVVAATVVVFQLAAKNFGDLNVFLEGAMATVSVTGGEGLGGDVFSDLLGGIISVILVVFIPDHKRELPRADSSYVCRNWRHIVSLSRGR